VSNLSIKFGAVTIAGGDSTPTVAKGTDFGTVAQGGSAVSHTFQFAVNGTYTENVTAITAPPGFSVQPLAGSSPTTLPHPYNYSGNLFSLTLNTSVSGVKSGTVRITYTEDGVPQSDYTFSVTGTVSASPDPPQTQET
jgi:hypothetical protein